MIPPLDARGLLPPGVWCCTLESIPSVFCTNDARWRLWDDALAGLDVLCAQLQTVRGAAPALVLGGSFFSDKPRPDDIEATLIFAPSTPPEHCWTWVLLQSQLHPTLKARYRLDFYVTLPGHNNFSEFFQYVGPKTAAAKALPEKSRRGVVRVLEW